jgi:alanyl-tRNA synthetase
MVQFKDLFLGSEKRSYVRACSSQRCVRAGGKHNDLENVGYTARHHTFFEMLGNFSFGDYFKREAIKYGWEFLTEVMGLPKEKLWVTVHISDDEAEKIWKEEIGVDPARFSKLDEDNFWQMGDTGPCGPCSEIFYDHGPDVAGGPPGSPDEDGDRYIEIWNLVFMQYERSADGTLTPLPNPSIDTGMGLERIAAVMQGVHSNYEIDLFQSLLQAVMEVTGTSDRESKSLCVIADHIRSCAFLVLDGVIPGNEGRAYVLRRIVRRAIRHGHKLGARGAFFYKLVAPLVKEMGAAYPELKTRQAQVEKVLLAEEEQFAKTLDKGMSILNEVFDSLSGKEIPGDVVFKLYDTYGFPTDLTNDIARERGLVLDMAGYEQAMSEQRKRSQDAGSFSVDYTRALQLEGETVFKGYEQLAGQGRVTALLKQGEDVSSLSAGEDGVLVLDQTPFYAESGGQVGDKGVITAEGMRFEVFNTTKGSSNHLHHGKLMTGEINIGDQVSAQVAAEDRQATALNHSATHILHAALRKVLGEHVTQKGSLVDPERLRFDFSHFEALTSEQLQQIEGLVNQQIRMNTQVETTVTDMETAKAKGAMALFGEKYGDQVRVLTMGEGFSVELCGGTHATRTGDIGFMRIISESGIAAGVRRIEAVTGAAALNFVEENRQCLEKVARLVKGSAESAAEKVEQLLVANKKLEKELQQLKAKLASSTGSDLASQAREICGIKVLSVAIDGADRASLLSTMDQLKNKLGSSVVMLAAVDGAAITLVAGVSKDLSASLKAGDLMKQITAMVGGKGGGRPDMAQGGGSDIAALPKALEAVYGWVEAQRGA